MPKKNKKTRRFNLMVTKTTFARLEHISEHYLRSKSNMVEFLIEKEFKAVAEKQQDK